MMFENLPNDLRIIANLAKVNGLSAVLDKEKSVETFEEQGRRLVDCAENGLSLVSEFSQELDQIPGTVA